jgi:hypothetical protein
VIQGATIERFSLAEKCQSVEKALPIEISGRFIRVGSTGFLP